MPEIPVIPPSGPTLEARLPCPVCLGVMMEKVQMGGRQGPLTLDHCTRCGGVWFEQGETALLARIPPSDLWKHIPPRREAPRPPCHGCHAPLDRDADRCPACGTENRLQCPHCARAMERRQHASLILDVCATCKGVWFDHAELRSVWTIAAEALSQRQRGRGSTALAVGGDVLLESLFWAPGLTINAGIGIAQGLGSVVGALGSVSAEGAASAAMGAAEAAGGAAEGVFGMIMEIIGGIFD